MPQSSDNPHAVRLGRQLRRLRLAAGYATQTAFGPRIGYGDDSISKVEGRRVPTRELLTAWLGACEKSIDGARQVLTGGEREAITVLGSRPRGPERSARVYRRVPGRRGEGRVPAAVAPRRALRAVSDQRVRT